MQRRMLAVAALAAVAAAGPIAAAEGAASKAKAAQNFVYGGVTSSGYPVVIRLSKTGKQVVRADDRARAEVPDAGRPHAAGLLREAPDRRRQVRRAPTARQELPGDPATGVSKVVVSGFIKGRVNKARTQIKGTWSQKVIAYSAADPTGATVLDTCDSGVVSYTADN